MADDILNQIIDVLRDRGIPYDRNALKSELADPENQTAVQEWVDEYLSPETLLTKDEEATYAGLIKTGDADSLSVQDLALVQGLTDMELQAAVKELKRSTAVIEKQSDTLRVQQIALSSLVGSERRTRQSRLEAEKGQVRKWDAEKNSVLAAVSELTQNLKFQTADLEQQLKASEMSATQTVDSILKSDDKVLLSLQKLANDLEPRKSDDNSNISHIRELCARYIKYTVEGVRTRLDRIYLETLKTFSNDEDSNDDAREANELQEELESLYSEILPVAQMVAEQQYLEPALLATNSNSDQGQERTFKAFEYIHKCLTFLINRIEVYLEKVEEYQCNRMAVETMIDAAKIELSRVDPILRPPDIKKAKIQGRGLSAAYIPASHRSGLGDENVEPEQQLARTLGVALPAEGDSNKVIVKKLERILMERSSKLEAYSASLQSTIESSMSCHLLNAHTTLNLLHDALLTESSYRKIRLVNPDLEGSMVHLEKDIEDVREKLEAIDFHALKSRNVHRDKFVERWSR